MGVLDKGSDWYKRQSVQPIQYIEANNLSFSEGNVIKYVTRHKYRDGAKDIRKAIHYLELILKFQYGEEGA